MYRRLRPARVRDRAALPAQERTGTYGLRPVRFLGPSLRHLDARGRRILRVQAERQRLRAQRGPTAL